VRRATVTAAGLLLAALVLRVVLGEDQLGRAVDRLSHPALPLLLLALLCELGAYVAYASSQQRLVRAAGHRLSLRWLGSLAVAAQALNNFLPAGYLVANVVNFKELRRRRLGGVESAWVLLLSSILNIGSLIGLSVIAALAAGSDVDVALGALAIILAGLLCLLARPRLLPRLLTALSDRLRGRPGSSIAALRQRASESGRALAALKLSRRTACLSTLLFAASWLSDAGCLTLSLKAVGASPAWGSLLLAYCAGQLVSFLPVTPGGVGLVEGSMALAMAAGGTSGVDVLSGVLLYRAISYWGTLPAGALGYLALRLSRGPHGDPASLASEEWSATRISAAPSSP
jgi:putative heme transporter